MAHSGAGDPAQTLELLWRDDSAAPRATRRGPRQGLTVHQVVAAAIELADSEGVSAVTMRQLARLLKVAPMSLYTYVPGKGELLDLMLDMVYARMPRADLSGTPWRDRVTTIAEENWELYERHPWVATVSTSRPPLGPGFMTKYEHELSAFAGLGLGDIEIDAALSYVLNFVHATARAKAEAAAVQRDSAMDDEQWWATNAPVLARVFDQRKYPTAARVGAAAGAAYRGAYSPAHAYEFGLRRVLDGLGVLIENRRAP